MPSPVRIPTLLTLVAALVTAPATAQSPSPTAGQRPAPSDTTTNLKVLPPGTSRSEVVRIMRGYARALGVDCTHCHVGNDRRPPRPEDFALDEKPEKQRAREMMRMVNDINTTYLARLDKRSEPSLQVECATCHRGITEPRMLRDVLKSAYGTGGVDSTLARYRTLRTRYYGTAAYDFGDGPLVDLARALRDDGKSADALRLLAFNVEMNPTSTFARRQHATAATFEAFSTGGVEPGGAAFHSMKDTYGNEVVSDALLGDVARQLLAAGKVEAGMAALSLAVAEYPQSTRALINLGDALARQGDRAQAAAAYQKAARLDPTDPLVQQRLAPPGAPPQH
jgi:tetratricopeptide (TPR) repeat protein